MSAPRCKARHCGETMVDRIDGLGRMQWDCPKCPRTKRGLCRDCPRRREPDSLRCKDCRKKRKKAQYKRIWHEHKDRYLAQRKEKYHTNETWRQHRLKVERDRYWSEPKTPLTRKYNAHKQANYRARKRQQRAAA